MIREVQMGQLGFFDTEKRLAALSAKGDPLEAIDRLVPWETFRADIETVVLTPEEMRKSSAGRKPIDAIVMFRMLVLQALNNLSDEQAEYQVRDRLSFTRFLRLGIEDSIPEMRYSYTHSRKARGQHVACALAPLDRTPGSFRQSKCKLLDRDRLML